MPNHDQSFRQYLEAFSERLYELNVNREPKPLFSRATFDLLVEIAWSILKMLGIASNSDV